jgi:hypothetical protein
MDGVDVSLTMKDPPLVEGLDFFFQAAGVKHDAAT